MTCWGIFLPISVLGSRGSEKDFATQLAKDYPKSFVRSLEFHIGDEYYKKQKFTEYDIAGFKEQVQVKIDWKDRKPIVRI